MGVYLNPGNEMFQMTVNSQIYVDKSKMISFTNRMIGSEQRYICVSRPRRFGKSIAASMLTAYYSKNCDSNQIFGDLQVAKDTQYHRYMNTCNVIAINMQSFFSLIEDMTEALGYLQKRIIRELAMAYPDIVDRDERFLSIVLEDIYAYNKERFVFIIDEWDCVLRDRSYTENDQRKYLDFIRNLLKDRVYVSLAYMTGILPIKKYGTHSALNMFIEYSMTDPGELAEFVGFTEAEVRALCQQYEMNFEAVRSWYDGYQFMQESHIYNPKSVVESILRNNISSYWTQTETYEALRIYLELDFDGLKQSIMQMLAGERVRIDTKTFQNDMTSMRNQDDVLTLLIHLGYLAFDQISSSVYIPNSEIAAEFIRAIKNSDWGAVINAIEHSQELLQATWNMEEEKVAEILDEAHQAHTSILTYNDENSLSCVIALAYYAAQNEYVKVRELPSGKGFADIVFIPKRHSDKTAIIVELKYDKSAEGAISQIKEKRYVDSLEEYQGDLILVGINYDKKSKRHDCIIEKVEK